MANPMKRHVCEECGKEFGSRKSLLQHKAVHDSKQFPCPTCGATFTRKSNLERHMKTHTVQEGNGAAKDQPTCDEAALGGTVKTRILTGIGYYDPMKFLHSRYGQVLSILKKTIRGDGAIKWYLALKVKMSRQKGEEKDIVEPYFRGKCEIALKVEDLNTGLQESIKKIYTSFIEFQRQGSNWNVDKVVHLKMHMARYKPLVGSSYLPLPLKLRAKKAIVNVKNEDEECLKWALLSAMHPVAENPHRVTKYSAFQNELDFTGITFPAKLGDISKVESKNQLEINVFGWQDGEVIPLHVTNKRFNTHVDLLLITNGKTSHYCWIKSLSRLLNDHSKHNGKCFPCSYCLHFFSNQRCLDEHIPYCQVHGPQKIELPKEENKWLFYQDVRKQLKVPYVIYADFESLQVPILGCSTNPEESSTEKVTKHVPCGYAYKVVGLAHEHSKDPVIYRGSNTAEHFVDAMVIEQDEIVKKFKNCEPMRMTGKDWQTWKKSTHCHICEKELGSDRVRDHCHVTGKFRGAAHNACNINFKFTGRIPVVFHNLRGYDSHIIMQAIGKIQDKPINCIPNNMEKYISFSLGCMDFIDSFQFMPSSLEKLVINLAKEGSTKFNHMTQHFGSEKLPLLVRKQVFPYSHFDSMERFIEQELPSIDTFYSTLSGEDISTSDYQHAQLVWQTFGIQDLGQYHDLYVLTDVLALADVFENFRNICQESYGLDPCHFYTSPGLAWQAALKMTGVRLELLTDIDMHLFIEEGLRGGTSTISHRYSEANNSYIHDYNSNKPDRYILYLDANNLYGWAMSQALPVSDFQWLTPDEYPDATQIADDGPGGYVFEVDLDYPQCLHDLHNEYPLAPERFKVTEDMLSPYAKSLSEEIYLHGTAMEKLIPNLKPKKKYVLHYRNLKLYLSLGMKIANIHRVLRFTQQPWLKPYVDFNTAKRKEAGNEFEKDFYKLMNNAVFGKTMENLRKRVDVKLVQGPKRAKKLIAKPSFHAFRIFSENLVAVHMLKQKLYLNRPIYVGFSILDVSKTLMYDFHYNYIKTKYGSRAQLLFTDTDSLCYQIETKDVYQDMLDDQHLFDTSDYPPNHHLYTLCNKKVLGKFKDETRGIPIESFVGLKSKMYSLIYEENGVKIEKKTAKGIKKNVIKLHTRHEHYKQCLFNRKIKMAKMTQIRSFGHQLYNVELNKLGLSPFDDKRYLLEDGITSLAYGHYKIALNTEQPMDQ